MTRNTLGFTASDINYLLSVSLREPEILQRLRQETRALPDADMQISADQGQFMSFLVRLLNARKLIEIGVFTGYSSLWMAMAMAENGRLVACDTDAETTTIARKYWQEAGVADKIDLRIAPALETLDSLIDAGEADSFDFIFIDADKINYRDYYERGLVLIRTGGIIAVDNVLWYGKPADPDIDDEDTRAIRAFNEFLHQDRRIELTMLSIADGLTLAKEL